tara:strand:+ start:1079 stop:1294 length:216 start_codon:yes stop_codon:yes gene_type:complete
MMDTTTTTEQDGIDKARDTLKVFTGGKRGTDLADEMCRAVKAAVYEFSGHMPLATAIGVLEIAKKEILDGK